MPKLFNPIIFSVFLLGIAFLLAGIIYPEETQNRLLLISGKTLTIMGPFYLFLGLFVVLLLFAIAFSPFGKKKLGKGKPAYPLFAWIAMLYSTGMGAGLLLRAVQEPVFYFLHPFSEQHKEDPIYALQYSFFHWGLTPWGFYTLFGFLMAYYHYIENKPLQTDVFFTKKNI